MAIDFTKPATSDNYFTDFVPNIQGNQTELARWLDSSQSTITGTPPTYAKRYNRTSSAVEEYNGTSWAPIVFHGLTYSSGNIGIGGTPGAKLDLLGSVASNPQAIFTRGVTDPNFQLVARNGVTGSASGTVVSQVGLEYGGGFSAGIKFARGGGSSDSILSLWANSAQVLLLDNTQRVGVNAPIPRTTLHVTGSGGTSSGSLSLSPYTAGGGGTSYIMMGNSDSGGVSGPSMITAANRALSFGVGTDFTSASGGTYTEWVRFESGAAMIGTNSILNAAKLTVSAASGVARVSIQSQLAGNSDASLYLEAAGTNAGEIIYYRASTALAFLNGGAEIARINPSSFAIGTTGALNNSAKLRVYTNVNTYAAELYASGSAVRLTLANDNNLNVIESNSGALIFYRNSGSLSEAARIDVNGYMGVGVVPTAGQGRIQLDASANSGIKLGNVNNTTATVLDWYEEGTFTPTMVGQTTAGTTTYTEQSGEFTRIGNRVFFNLKLRVSTMTGTGALFISGLPYAIAGNGNITCSATVTPAAGFTMTFSGMLTATFGAGGGINLTSYASGGAATNLTVGQANGFCITGWYTC